jgi:hypothetical protein
VRYQIYRKRPDDTEPILAFSTDDKRFAEVMVKDVSGTHPKEWLYIHDTEPVAAPGREKEGS